MRKIRVCVYGGTNLDEKASAFVSALAYEVLARMDAVILSPEGSYTRPATGSVFAKASSAMQPV